MYTYAITYHLHWTFQSHHSPTRSLASPPPSPPQLRMRPLALSLPAIPDLFQVQGSEQSSEDDIEELHTFRIPDQCHQRDADCNLCTICRPSTGACECLRGREGEGGEGGGEEEGGEGRGEGGRRGREEREGGEGGKRRRGTR